eukprot:TRINITY_DN72163_c0_g1_i1.p1 TRINITY_DN72163_c0_g1~~TRINITY_DN72163_c0_g1_i1.p1  ORF type:complete len:105 (-),score=5.87 TRINITY_DN72163_c0_g1_i1:92-361(-)
MTVVAQIESWIDHSFLPTIQASPRQTMIFPPRAAHAGVSCMYRATWLPEALEWNGFPRTDLWKMFGVPPMVGFLMCYLSDMDETFLTFE